MNQTQSTLKRWCCSPVLQVFSLGAFSFLAYFHLTSVYPLPALVSKVNLTDFARLGNYSRDALFDFLLSVSIPIALYFAGWRIVRHLPFSRRLVILIFAFAIIFAVTLLLMYPIGATDLFNYVFYSRILVRYGQNPLSVPPSAFRSDPFYSRVLWYNTPSPYGPLWHLLTIPGSLLAGDDLVLNLLLMNALSAIFFLGCAVVIFLILKQIDPAHAPAGTLLFAWNPLVLFETAGNGHNGIIMMFFVLAAIYLLVKQRWVWVLPALVASVLVKYVSAILLLPFLIYCLAKQDSWRSRIRYLALTAILSALLFSVISARFLSMPTGAIDEANWYSLLAVPTLLFNLVKDYWGEANARTWVIGGSLVAYLALYLVSLRYSKFRQDTHALILLSTWVITAYLVVASVYFMPWFIKWLIALGIWLNHALLRRVLLAFTASGLLSYGVNFFWVWNWDRWQRVNANALYVAVVFLPPLIIWLASIAWKRWGKPRFAAWRAALQPSRVD